MGAAGRLDDLAYAVIIGGGLLITRRLRLSPSAATFWVALAVGVGLLAASGHCMVARWAFAPVCGFDFWRVIVTSPEVLIFLFFMITDPKTMPPGRVGRMVFGSLVAVVSTLLLAPQTNEFGTKVALLAGLVVVCAARPLLDRLVPEPRSAADDLGRFATAAARAARRRRRGRSAAPAGSALGAGRLVVGVGIVAAGEPARLASSSRTRRRCSDRVPARRRPRDVPVDHRRAGRRGLEPRDRRRRAPRRSC